MTTYREDYWKLAEVEDRFNRLQGGLRSVASTWTLAAFAGLAVLLQVPEKSTWLAPPAFLAWLICILGVFGLALLWLMDQFVYQRLLDAPFLSGLLLEETYSDLPPMRALMLSGSSSGMSKHLKLFYFIPIVLFCLLSIAAVATDVLAAFPKPVAYETRLSLTVGSVLAIIAVLVMYRLSGKVGARALAKSVGFDSARAVEPDRLAKAVRVAIQRLDKIGSADGNTDKEAAQPAATDTLQAARR